MASDLISVKELLDPDAHFDPLKQIPMFFIGGLPRSGTTWIQQLTNAHPEVMCMGESQFMSSLVPNLGKVLLNYTQRRNEEAAVWAPAAGQIDRETVTRIVRFALFEILRHEGRAKDLSQVTVIGEKTPENMVNMPRITGLLPQARFIQVIRDGRAGAISAWHRFRKKLPQEMTWHEYVRWYAKEWVERNRIAMRDALEGRSTRVFYEAMHRDPVGEAANLFDFLGVSTEPAVVEAAVEAARFESLSGGRRAGQVDQSSHYRRGEVDGWKTELDATALEIFEREAGELMDQYGYERVATTA